jgi:hypothetical protein
MIIHYSIQMLQVYKNLIAESQEEEAPVNRQSLLKPVTITNLNNYATTNNRKCNGPSPRVGIRPKEVIRISFEEPSPAASISESVSVEEKKRDDDEVSRGQRRKCSRERRLGGAKETSVLQKQNKLEAFIVNSGILQNEKDEVVIEVSLPLDSNASQSNIVLAPDDEREPTDSVDERQPENQPTETLSPDKDVVRTPACDEIPNTSQGEQLHSTENLREQPMSEPINSDTQIEEQPSVDSACSVTEKWKRLMDGEGYVPSELPLNFLGQKSSEEFRNLFDSVTKNPIGDVSGRSFAPTASLADTTIAAEEDVQSKRSTPDDDARQLNELSHWTRDHHDLQKHTPPSEASIRHPDELTHQARDHGSPQQEPPTETSIRGAVHGTMTRLFEYADKLFSSSITMKTKDDDSRYSTVSQVSRVRSSKIKNKRKSKKGRKRVRFDDEAEHTPFYERWMYMCY